MKKDAYLYDIREGSKFFCGVTMIEEVPRKGEYIRVNGKVYLIELIIWDRKYEQQCLELIVSDPELPPEVDRQLP